MTTSSIQAKYLVLEPASSSEVPNGCLFLDQGNGNILSQKSATGVVGVISSSANSNPMIKQMVSGETFPTGKPLAKRPDGKVVLADSDDPTRTTFIGWSMTASLAMNSVVSVMAIGVNLPGILSGLGFTPGDRVYMGEIPGTYTNNPDGFTGSNDDVYQLGIADCPSGVAQNAATDLIASPRYVTSYS